MAFTTEIPLILLHVHVSYFVNKFSLNHVNLMITENMIHYAMLLNVICIIPFIILPIFKIHFFTGQQFGGMEGSGFVVSK